jgi:EpsI family protein
MVVSVGLLLAAFAAVHVRSSGEAVQSRSALETLPRTIGQWTGRDDTVLDSETLRVLKLSDYVMRRYTDPAGHLSWLYIGYWQSQRKGSDIHSPKNCLPGGGWEPIEASLITIPLAKPHEPITVNLYVIQKEKQIQVAIYWFQSQGKAIAGELGAKIQLVRGAILNNRTDGAIVRVTSPVQGSVQETRDRLIQYIQVLYPTLEAHLPR